MPSSPVANTNRGLADCRKALKRADASQRLNAWHAGRNAKSASRRSRKTKKYAACQATNTIRVTSGIYKRQQE